MKKLREIFGGMEIPNCDDPIFRTWCQLCNVQPGGVYERRDPRIAQLQQLMQEGFGEGEYDPETDPDDDYLTRGL